MEQLLESKIIEDLFEKADLWYKDFTSKSIPNIPKETIIGVRIPDLRTIAKSYKEKDATDFLHNLPHQYHEENIIHGILLNNIKDIEELIAELNLFLPYITNWAVCDLISLKLIKKNPKLFYKEIIKWLKSKKTYTLRFAITTLLAFYLDDNFASKDLKVISKIKSKEYYVNMAIAWYYSFALIKQYNQTIYLFQENKLDKWIHNKSIQKAIESHRISNETKNYLRSLRVK